MQNHEKEYFIKALQHIKSEELKLKLEEYFLNEIDKLKKRCRDERIAGYTTLVCNQINELNNPELEYYIEYALEFYDNIFELVFYMISSICKDVNFYLSQICDNYLRYSGDKDKEELMDTIFKKYENRCQENPEMQEVCDAVIAIEKQHILNCYNIAREGNTFCELCGPFCSKTVKDIYSGDIVRKRTIPNRG